MRLCSSILFAAFGTMLLLLTGGCGGGGGGTPPITGSAIIAGTVRDAQTNEPLAGVILAILHGASTTSGADGSYTLAGAPSGLAVSITARKGDAYIAASTVLELRENTSAQWDVSLAPANPATAITPTNESNVADGTLATVTIPANGLVTAQGGTPTTANVQVTAVTADDPAFGPSFPGSFMCVDTPGGATAPMEALGYVTITATGSDGAALKLATGKEATITLRLSPDPVDATLDLYWLNPATGIWEKAGTATRLAGDPGHYQATVSHFSTYAPGRRTAAGRTYLVKVIFGDEGAAVPGAFVTLYCAPDYLRGKQPFSAKGYSNEGGMATFILPANTDNPALSARFGKFTTAFRFNNYDVGIMGYDGKVGVTDHTGPRKNVSVFVKNLDGSNATNAKVHLFGGVSGFDAIDLTKTVGEDGQALFGLQTGVKIAILAFEVWPGATLPYHSEDYVHISSPWQGWSDTLTDSVTLTYYK